MPDGFIMHTVKSNASHQIKNLLLPYKKTENADVYKRSDIFCCKYSLLKYHFPNQSTFCHYKNLSSVCSPHISLHFSFSFELLIPYMLALFTVHVSFFHKHGFLKCIILVSFQNFPLLGMIYNPY